MKHIDFKPDRSLAPQSGILLNEPKLASLFRAKAFGGPLDGAWIEAQLTWNGVVGRGHLSKPYPGRYVYTTERLWVWEDHNPISNGLAIG